ncbi:MAG TPA: DUF2497 domain-containing protein [Roseomonas sp.]|jgi:cell pole-organizing protein PopZ
MSGLTAPGQDPSMEDILASIRKILNEEESAPGKVAGASEPEPLELTEAMLVTPPAPETAQPAEPVIAVTLTAPVSPEREPQPAPPPPQPSEVAEGLVAPATAAAAAALLGQLARTVAAERAAPVHRGGPSIEDVVREEVRPLLKEWMDAHLPALMERLVRAEIERVVSRSLG